MICPSRFGRRGSVLSYFLLATVVGMVPLEGGAQVLSLPGRSAELDPGPTASAQPPAAFIALVRDLMVKGGVPGLAAAEVRQGKIAWRLGLGVTSVSGGAPVRSDTVFAAASLGKPVFAYAVMRLAERGEFDLDRPLPEYLEYPQVEDQERLRRVTARRVLCHTTGLPNWRRGDELAFVFEPGDRFGYSGEGYAYLQKVLESITGLPLDQLIRREVFAPLGMDSSSFVWRDGYRRTAAIGHDYLEAPTKEPRTEVANAATSLWTTATDYAHFLAEILRPTLLKPGTAAAMLRPQVSVAPDLAWSLGWGVESRGARPLLWHWGDNRTFSSFAIGEPASGIAFVLLTNSENGLGIAEPIVSAVIPGPHPAFAWLDVDRYDSAARTIRERLVRAGVANGGRGVARALSELEATYPREAFTESLLSRIGYELLSKKRPDAAAEVLERNVKLHPGSWNAYASLGEAHATGGDVRLAISAYEKSLALNPQNENAKAAIRQLKAARRR
jgi:CubicO group peptidase (beta-lactamase class C family)